MVKKSEIKKFAKKVKKAYKGSAKTYKKYAPRVHRGLAKTSEALYEGVAPTPRRKHYVDLTPGVKPKKVMVNKKPYWDFR